MTRPIDMTDIPVVTADDMWQVVELLIDSGLIEALPGPLTDLQMDQLAGHFWQNYTGTGDRGLAIIHRFMALVDFLAAKRLRPLMNKRKWHVVVASVGIAATMRLNPKWGFNRMTLAAALDEQLRSGDVATAPTDDDEVSLQALIAPALVDRRWHRSTWTARDGFGQEGSRAS